MYVSPTHLCNNALSNTKRRSGFTATIALSPTSHALLSSRHASRLPLVRVDTSRAIGDMGALQRDRWPTHFDEPNAIATVGATRPTT